MPYAMNMQNDELNLQFPTDKSPGVVVVSMKHVMKLVIAEQLKNCGE